MLITFIFIIEQSTRVT